MTILRNIQTIQDTFKSAQQLASQTEVNEDFYLALNSISAEFRSVAYEGASFTIAQRSIYKTGNLDLWKQFKSETKGLHESQIHVGLGWALASLNVNIEDYISSMSPYMVSRVIDGYGYYFAMFKRRIAIRTAQVPKSISDLNKMSFDQGLGRSLWYLSEGKIEKLKRLLTLIPEDRHSNLWRGIGIAYAYVGGINSVDEIEKTSSQYKPDFKCGIALAMHSRMKSGSLLESSTVIGEKALKNTSETLEKITGFKTSDLYSTSIKYLKEFL